MSDDPRTSLARSQADIRRQRPNPDAFGTSGRCANPRQWVRVLLVREDDVGIEDEPYVLTLPDGTERRGRTDANGVAEVSGFSDAAGQTCQVSFPQLDAASWFADRGRPTQIEGGPIDRAHRVGPQECIPSIALRYGLSAARIWDHSANAALKKRRKSMYVLAEGDEVQIPRRQPKMEPIPVGHTSIFIRPGSTEILRLHLCDEKGRARAGAQYLLEVEGTYYVGTLGQDGRLEVPVAATARRARLRLRDDVRTEEIQLLLSDLDPWDTPVGSLQRLDNLGSPLEQTDDWLPPPDQEVLGEYQKQAGLRPDGQLNRSTQERLYKNFRV